MKDGHTMFQVLEISKTNKYSKISLSMATWWFQIDRIFTSLVEYFRFAPVKFSNFCTHHFDVLKSRIMFFMGKLYKRIWFIPKIVVLKNWKKNWLVQFFYKKSFIVAIDHIYQCKELETLTQRNQKYSRTNVKYCYFEIVMLSRELETYCGQVSSLYFPQTRNNPIDQSGIYRILFI